MPVPRCNAVYQFYLVLTIDQTSLTQLIVLFGFGISPKCGELKYGHVNFALSVCVQPSIMGFLTIENICGFIREGVYCH